MNLSDLLNQNLSKLLAFCSTNTDLNINTIFNINFANPKPTKHYSPPTILIINFLIIVFTLSISIKTSNLLLITTYITSG